MLRPAKSKILLFSALIAVLMITSTALANVSTNWPSAGYDINNTRNQSSETTVGVNNVASLVSKWQFSTGGDVSATPAIDDTNIYFPDWAGNLYAVNKVSGIQLWSHKISDYTGVAGDFSRATPVIDGNELIFGDQAGRVGSPASIIAVDKNTGDRLWTTQADSFPFSIITQSAVVSGKNVFVGVSSFEELYSALIPGYTCCGFRGSMLDLNASTGAVIWHKYTVPAGYSGGAVWGSTPVVDTSRKAVYIGTGNNYSVPDTVATCMANNPNDPQKCLASNDYFDSVISYNIKDGSVNWAMHALTVDDWNTNCLAQGAFNIPGFNPDPSQCQSKSSPDYDFGQGPVLFTVTPASGSPYNLLGIGQKSGQFWAINPDTGAPVWETQVGPGSYSGGLMFGSATDGKLIYTAVSNGANATWNLVQNGVATNTTTNGGLWSALDPATGKIVWQTANPTGAGNFGAVSVANGVVYSCSADGILYALNGSSGNILWQNNIGSVCESGVSISNGMLYVGTGYTQNPIQYQVPNKLFAFGLP